MPSRFVTHFGQSNVTAVEVISSDVKKRKMNRSDVEKRTEYYPKNSNGTAVV